MADVAPCETQGPVIPGLGGEGRGGLDLTTGA